MSENRVSNEIHRSSHKQIHRKLSNSHLDYCYEEDYDNKITKNTSDPLYQALVLQ